MAKRQIPDPDDRSVNSPSVIVDSDHVLAYYNQHNEAGDEKERVVDSVKAFYTERALNLGWAEATFHGSQCVLTAKINRT